MIIVSQDKDNIINFEQTKHVWLDDNVLDKTDATFNIIADDEIIGKYATEERAKEVLQEIIECYKDTNYEYENCWCLRNLVYELPKE